MKPAKQWLLALVAVGVVAAACSGGNGDGGGGGGGGTATPTPGGGDDDDDGGTVPGSYSAFVIDLIENQTADDTEPVAVDFDSEEGDQDFSSLFD